MNLFDDLQDNVFDTVQKVMGYPCVWEPSQGGDAMTITGLLNEPTTNEKLGFVTQGYDGIESMIEYREGQFPGLWESTRSGNDEYILGNGNRYFVHHVVKRYDGKTLIAYLQSAPENE